MSPTRRTLLASCATGLASASLAGCLGGSSRGVADLVVHNEADQEYRVTTTVTNADGETLLEETATLAGGATTEYENEVAMDQTVTLDVATADGPSATTEWDVTGTYHARIGSGDVTFAAES